MEPGAAEEEVRQARITRGYWIAVGLLVAWLAWGAASLESQSADAASWVAEAARAKAEPGSRVTVVATQPTGVMSMLPWGWSIDVIVRVERPGAPDRIEFGGVGYTPGLLGGSESYRWGPSPRN